MKVWFERSHWRDAVVFGVGFYYPAWWNEQMTACSIRRIEPALKYLDDVLHQITKELTLIKKQ